MKDEVRRLGSLKRTSKGHASLTVTGVGKEKALAAVASLCDGGNPPSLVLSIGFSGALSDDLSVGDLVLARRLLSTDGSPPLTIDLRLFQLAEAAIHENALPYVRRDTLTAGKLVRTRSERKSSTGNSTPRPSAWKTIGYAAPPRKPACPSSPYGRFRTQPARSFPPT